MSDPFATPDLYDAIVLDGVRSPGVVTLSGHERAQDWDIKRGSGQDGATTERKGTPVGQFTATFDLVNDPLLGNQIAAWDDFQRVIERSTSGPQPVALPIEHPDLARNLFTAVVNGGIGGMNHDGAGRASVAVKFLEHRPPKPKGGTPKGGSSKPGGDDPNAAAKKELDGLLDEAKKP